MYRVKMTDGAHREVERREGLELVAGKQATWDPPLARQMLREGDAVKEQVEGDGGEARTRVIPASAAAVRPAPAPRRTRSPRRATAARAKTPPPPADTAGGES